MLEDNISALSTPPIASGVAIIRISGKNPLEIAEKMFKCKTNVFDFEPNKLYVGTIDGGSIKDYGMCVYFSAPKSYTGENMVEFHCHGGVAISRAILKRTFELGARPAERGEFTKRAFLNGKLSLSSCEGLIDMINAESEGEVKAGYYLYKEKLFNKITEIQADLKYVLALIDANIDYPEEDIKSAELDEIKEKLQVASDKIYKITQKYLTSSKIKTGVKVVICGKPNAGKSSILNLILGCDKAIVTSVEGTTRDVVEGSKEYGGIKFNYFDTAGIRESQDTVEKIGIERSKQILETADVVLFVLDAEKGWASEDKEIFSFVKDKNLIVAKNKDEGEKSCDFPINIDISISAKTGLNFEKLEQMIFEKAQVESALVDGEFLTEERHYLALSEAYSSLKSALSQIGIMPLDILTVDIKNAWRNLGLISGETCDEAVVDEIFSKFCVGK